MSLMSLFMDIEKKVEEPEIKPKSTFFEDMNAFFNKTLPKERFKDLSIFMVLQILSNNDRTLTLAEYLTCSKMDDVQKLIFLDKCLPKGSYGYAPKKRKSKKEALEFELEKLFKVSSGTARRYAKDLTPKDKKYLKSITKDLVYFD